MTLLQSKHYYIDLINSSKACKFTARWHYSGIPFKKAQINQGIYRKSDNKLVGVLQWGCSAQQGIRLDRYVTDPITIKEYLELNRFCMDDEEGRNSESEAISLGISWIKTYRHDIKLLVSYAGRKEGNYGYIYQATSWEYLGYFVSNGFWIVNGEERHQITLWNTYRNHCDTTKSFRDGLCEYFDSVVQTWTKQFIYIKRLDKRLHLASPILPYPKPINEYPICVKIQEYKTGIENKAEHVREDVNIYYERDEQLFSRRTLIRRGEIVRDFIAIYDDNGQLVDTAKTATEAGRIANIQSTTVTNAIKTGKLSGNHFFRLFKENEEPISSIEFDYVCEIDGFKFHTQQAVANYLGVSRQAVNQALKRKVSTIAGKDIIWKIKS